MPGLSRINIFGWQENTLMTTNALPATKSCFDRLNGMMNKLRIAVLTVGMYLIIALSLSGQPPADNMEQYQKQYNERILLTHIHGIYIPENLEDAFRELEAKTPEASLKSYREAPEDKVVDKLYYSLGRWIVYNWGFYEGSRMSHYLRQKGVYHPEDAARVIMRSWHRHLNEKPIDLDSQIKMIQEKVAQEEALRMKEGTIIQSERKPAGNK